MANESDNNLNKNKVENDINKLDNTDEIREDVNDEISNEPEYVTREINLDDLYDGAVNNTVVIDPITNDEVLLSNKKPNYTLLGIIIAVIMLLLLYYVNNKTDLGRTTKNVEPKTTTSNRITETKNIDSGILTCTYSSKSDAENQSVTFVANYKESKITNTNFNFVVVSNTDNESAVVADLKNQYETFFINNTSIAGNNVSYEKNDKGFTFNVETDYAKSSFDDFIITEGQTILYVKPSVSDTIEYLQDAYENKGFTCGLTNDLNKE